MPTEQGGRLRAFYLRHRRILNHLFTVKNLKPATIAGYRTAIADHLGPFGQEVGKSLHLNRLLASFYRDKPIVNRGIPSWDLSFVLMSLTKAPFENVKVASTRLDILFSQTQTSLEGGHYLSLSTKPFLSPDLSEDMTLCPIRALYYYLDRTSTKRMGKNLLFISFKEGFEKDIQRSTISSWITQTVALAY